jgi:voltage-gated potassium channel Kch
MSLTLATLLPGLLLIALGVLFSINNSAIQSTLKALPRSHLGAIVFFGGGALWFLYNVWNVSAADLVIFTTPQPWVLIFGALSALAFYYVPDFLAVRGLSVLTLLAAWPLLMAGFMEFRYPQLYLLKVFLYVCIGLAIWLGISPFRLRDLLQWLFSTRGRPRVLGGAMLAYGALLSVVAFTY